jgi:hypothetical protein
MKTVHGDEIVNHVVDHFGHMSGKSLGSYQKGERKTPEVLVSMHKAMINISGRSTTLTMKKDSNS